MGALIVGGDQVQMVMGLPSSVGLVLQGLLLFPLLAGSLFMEYRLKIAWPEKKTAEKAKTSTEAQS
jgi:simple sugar transport system permease protein